jgi:hypothetical protein
MFPDHCTRSTGTARCRTTEITTRSRNMKGASAGRALRALGDQPDLRYHIDGYRTSSAQILVLLGVVSLVFAGLLLRLANRPADRGGRIAAAVGWPWVAFLFVLCAARANPATGWRLAGDDGDFIVDDYLPGPGYLYLSTLAVLAGAMAALCLLNTAALLVRGKSSGRRR